MTDPQITYSVRDILARIEGKIDSALASIGLKASTADLMALSAKHETLRADFDRHVEAGEAERVRKSERVEWRRWAIPVLISLLGVVALVWSGLHR